MAKKLSTEEILKRARAEGAPGESKGGESSEPETTPQPEEAAPQAAQEEAQPSKQEEATEQPAGESAQEGSAAAEESAAEKKPAAPSGKPKSTKDILAAARAQDAGGKAKPSEEKKSAEKKPAASGGKPKSTKDILAAARAEGGPGKGEATQKPAAKESPKGAKPAKKAEPAEPKGEHPPVKEMVEALKKGRPLEEQKEKEGEKPSKPTRKPIPKKPPASPKKPPAEEGTSRRFVLVAVLLALFGTPFRAAWTLFTGAFGIFTLALARFMMPNVVVEPPSKFKIGPPSDYPFGTVATKWKDRFGIWLVHTNYQGQNQIYALISVCTHLGCTPNWLQGEQKFKCPCHGSGFYITGINFEGPAPRPLERAGIRLAPDGMLEVDKSQKFQEEMGQWQDPDSFVSVA